MTFEFLGLQLCRNAFRRVTGVGNSSLDQARDRALAGKHSVASREELGLALSVRNTSKAKLYLAARSWLEHYAEVYAEWSPSKLEAYLPGGKRKFYYSQYYYDVTTEHRNPDRLLASESVFYEAWRVEVPWLVICKSISMFTRCGVCEYLKLLIEQCTRNNPETRDALRWSAQRLAQARVEEACARSGGKKWFMKTDKADQQKTICPTIWSQLPVAFFKNGSRIVAGIIGSMWWGTEKLSHHVRTFFEDTEHGSEMQCSHTLLNLHHAATLEGYLPEEFHIGADNTPKETKNQFMCYFVMWLLCDLEGRALWKVSLLFLMVGHTHDALDRFFSRFMTSLHGHDYYTVDEMLQQAQRNLRYVAFQTGHLSQTWAWKSLPEPAEGRQLPAILGLRHAHAIEFYRADGIFMRWKQWMADEVWGPPVLVVPSGMAAAIASFRPAPREMRFSEEAAMLAWIDKFEHWLSARQYASQAPDDRSRRGCAWLRDAVTHRLSGTYAQGGLVDNIVSELRDLPAAPQVALQGPSSIPPDLLAQLYPGADVAPFPATGLLQVRVTPRGESHDAPCLFQGAMILASVTEDTRVWDKRVPFLLGMALDVPRGTGQVLASWWVPSLTKAVTYKAGVKKTILDLFGAWEPADELRHVDRQDRMTLPSPLIDSTAILHSGFDLEDGSLIPFHVLDHLRLRWKIDVTGLEWSLTQRGNIYRTWALVRGNPT